MHKRPVVIGVHCGLMLRQSVDVAIKDQEGDVTRKKIAQVKSKQEKGNQDVVFGVVRDKSDPAAKIELSATAVVGGWKPCWGSKGDTSANNGWAAAGRRVVERRGSSETSEGTG